MARATWNGKVIAESDVTETVEGNVYFPESSLKREYFRPSSTTSTCPWKGQARYMSLVIDGNENPDAAWYYPDPKPADTTSAKAGGQWPVSVVEFQGKDRELAEIVKTACSPLARFAFETETSGYMLTMPKLRPKMA